MAQQSQQHSFLSVSCSHLEPSENQLATMWGAFAKCKPYIENGTRLENMSWRLWQYQRQPTNYIDNTTIKRFITSVLLSPVNVHDAYSHEVAQPTQKCYTPTTTMAPAERLESATSSFIVVDETLKPDDMQAKEQQNEARSKDDDAYEDDEYEDDEDYYLSDDLYDDEDDDLYDDDEEDDHVDDVKASPSHSKEESQFNHDFRKMQPRPTTPRRSLLSDLLGRVSSPPSLLSNSTCSFTTNNSLTEDESSSASSSSSASTSSSTTTTTTTNNSTKYNTNHTSKIALNTQHHPFTTNTTNDPSEIRWRESFHGW